jgi:hypothetical protein
MCGGYTYSTATRILTTDDSVSYDDDSVILVVGYLTDTSSNSILTNEKIVNIMDNMSIHIAEAWIVKSGSLTDYNTYWGDGITWNLLKTI